MRDPKKGSLYKFWNDWNKVVDLINRKDIPEEFLEHLFYEAVREHEKLRTQIEHYGRVKGERPPHKDRCLKYLQDSVKLVIHHDREREIERHR